MEAGGDGSMEDADNTSILSKTIQLSSAMDNIGDKSFPMVFKCVKCREIVGDSSSWVCSNEDTRAVTLMRTKFPLFVSLLLAGGRFAGAISLLC